VKLERICIGLFVLGIVLMIPFEEWYTRLFGVAALLGFIVTGVFLIASPELIGQEPAGEDGRQDDAVRGTAGERSP
jgi:hypothetical protein